MRHSPANLNMKINLFYSKKKESTKQLKRLQT